MAPDSRTATRIARLTEALERARAGDSSGLDDIVVECTPLLWHVARSQGVRPEDVADVVQHTWLELVARLADIRTPSTLTAWLITTTKRESWRLAASGVRPPSSTPSASRPPTCRRSTRRCSPTSGTGCCGGCSPSSRPLPPAAADRRDGRPAHVRRRR